MTTARLNTEMGFEMLSEFSSFEKYGCQIKGNGPSWLLPVQSSKASRRDVKGGVLIPVE